MIGSQRLIVNDHALFAPFRMLQSLDIATLRVSSVLVSSSFGLVFACLWVWRRSDRHYAYWAGSSLLYAFTIVGFQLLPRSWGGAACLFGLLGLTDILLLSGLYSLERSPTLRWWMIIPLAAATCGQVLPHLASILAIPLSEPVARACEPVGLALAMGMTGIGFLRRAASDRRMTALAGMALLAYLPGYAFTIIAELGFASQSDLLALVPMLSDQVLLGILNLALLAIPIEQAQRQLSDAALRDPLTSVWNRAGLRARWSLIEGKPLTVLAIDIDHFKSINDRFGHAAGDDVLIVLAHVAAARAEAIGGMVVRMGGDEFIALLPSARGSTAFSYSEGVRRDLASHCKVPCTISIGMAEVDCHEGTVEQALRRADAALYRAKASGRNRLAA